MTFRQSFGITGWGCLFVLSIAVFACGSSGGGSGSENMSGGSDNGPEDPDSEEPDSEDPSPFPSISTDEKIVFTGAFASGTNTVSKTGSVYSLRFSGDETIEYQIDVASTNVSKGVVRVFEATSQCFPLFKAGPGFRKADGSVLFPDGLATFAELTAESSTTDSVILEYTDHIDGLHRRRHTFQILGKMLRVRIQSLDENLDFNSNYAGVFTGATSATSNPKIVQMQGNLATPLVLFEKAGQKYFYANQLDLFWSNASNWSLPDPDDVVPGSNDISFSYQTLGQYKPSTQGKLLASLDDTIDVIVSRKIKDVLVTPTQSKSPYRDQLAGNLVIQLGSDSTSWANYQNHVEDFRSWGMDHLAFYTHSWWSSSDLDGVQNFGPDWFPAKDESNFVTFVQETLGNGMRLGIYTLFEPMASSSHYYDESLFTQDASGDFKLGGSYPTIAETAKKEIVLEEANLIKENYNHNLTFTDVVTYASPSMGSSSDSLDQNASSTFAKTLRQAILERKTWFRLIQNTMQGPLLGEGSIATYASNMEWLWAGYCDSVQRTVNTGVGQQAYAVSASDPKAPTSWPVIPEYEYRVFAPLQANHGNAFPQRFFSAADGSGIFDTVGGSPIYPLTESALDRYRIYELSYGHIPYFLSNGPYDGTGNYLGFADMIREYYLLNSLQRLYMGSPVSSILYLHSGTLKTFEEILFQTATTDSFIDPRIRIEFENGLILFLNHNPTNWSIQVDSKTYLLPEDGFLATVPGSGFLCFSAIPPETSGERIDYCYAPSQYEFFDGRQQVDSYGSLDTAGAKGVMVENFASNRIVTELANGTIQVQQSAPPSVVALSESPNGSILTSTGSETGIRSYAVYSNGAVSEVTTLVSWSSQNESIAVVTAGSVLQALSVGSTTVRASYAGVLSDPIAVTVQ